MTNIMLTDVCNLSCPFCFAVEIRQSGKRAGSFISIDAFDARLAFLDRSGIDQVRLIGGEPTIHPLFPKIVERIRLRGKRLLVFSNGLMPEPSLACLESLPPAECLVLVNINASRQGIRMQPETLYCLNVLRRLGKRALPGVTIDRADFDFCEILTLIRASGCQRALRVGLAHPSAAGGNVMLNPSEYPIIGQRLAVFAKEAATEGVQLQFDCGFVRCMFSDSDLAALRMAGTDVGWRCNPILDIDLDGQCLHCFPLAALSHLAMDACTTADELRTALAQQVAAYRIAGVYRECSMCGFRRTEKCSGGCLAATIRRFRPSHCRVQAPLDNEETQLRQEATSLPVQL